MNKNVDLSGTAFGEVDRRGDAASFISYLDQATRQFVRIKTFTHSLLGLKSPERVLDVGCGTGHDVRELATMVAPNGLAVGVDKSESMIAEARRRTNGCGLPLQFEVTEAERLPWKSDYFDACRADRLLQHVFNPDCVLDEMLRVLKPGGRLVVVDRDWGMVALDSGDSATTRAVLDHACTGIRNGWIGRRLHGLFRRAGFTEIRVHTNGVNITSFDIADSLLDLHVVADHAISAEHVTRQAGDAWLNDLLERDRLGTFGSAQEFVETRILGCFLKNNEFGLGDCHALGLEQQIAEILVTTAPSKKGFDVAVDGFHHPEAYLGAAIVEDAVEVIQQHVSESLQGFQPLPS